MIQTNLKKMIKNNNITIGSWITLSHTCIAEIMANAGFDWLTVDMEHSAITLHEAQNLIQIIELCGVTPLVRVSENNPNLIKRVMDIGAHGVIVPMVNTKEDAENAVSAVKYPPQGKRGVGLYRAQGYGTKFDEYKTWVKNESIVVVQIEHIKAVENLKSILSTKGVDAFIVGPYDLSGSLGIPGEFSHPSFIKAMKEIQKVSSSLKITSGYHIVAPKPELVKEKIDSGYRFIAYSVDFLFLGQMCRGGLNTIKTFINKRG